VTLEVEVPVGLPDGDGPLVAASHHHALEDGLTAVVMLPGHGPIVRRPPS
jgi:hypothetical protein